MLRLLVPELIENPDGLLWSVDEVHPPVELFVIVEALLRELIQTVANAVEMPGLAHEDERNLPGGHLDQLQPDPDLKLRPDPSVGEDNATIGPTRHHRKADEEVVSVDDQIEVDIGRLLEAQTADSDSCQDL